MNFAHLSHRQARVEPWYRHMGARLCRLGQARETWLRLLLIAAVMAASVAAGVRPSPVLFGLLLTCLGAFVLLTQANLRPFALVLAALFSRFTIGTGTEVTVNVSIILLAFLILLWLLDALRGRAGFLVSLGVGAPMLLFLAGSFASLAAGTISWDPFVPRPANLLLVQLAQIAIFGLSLGAMLWFANAACDVALLQRVVFGFLLCTMPLVLLRGWGDLWWNTGGNIASDAIYAAPFWICVTALAAGQLLFNKDLGQKWRVVLVLSLLGVAWYCLRIREEKVAQLTGIGVVVMSLIFLRLPRRRRWLFLAACLACAAVFFRPIYEWVGGDDKWTISGASRLALSQRVIEMTARNPILGLGPAAYRHYGFMEPLRYGGGYWVEPRISAHNNWVDIYSQTGIIGLVLFIWFVIAFGRLLWRLRGTCRDGFAAGYTNAVLAALAASLISMLFLDWVLPFVYDVGFTGLQASLLLWMFFGGAIGLAAGRAGPGDQIAEAGQT